jgi:hypothetical protein
MTKMKNIKLALERFPLFLITLPFVFLINTANHYYHLLHWNFIIGDVILYLTIPIILYLLLARLWRSYAAAGVFMFFSLLIFYFFHLFYDWMKTIYFLPILSKYSVLLPVFLAGLILLFLYLRKKKRSFISFYYMTNLLCILLLMAGIIQYGILSMDDTAKKNDMGDPAKTLVKNYQSCGVCNNPDIYFIIFDGYTNSKTLTREFGYSNNSIETMLSERHFFVAHNSKSNYNFTHMSIGSELNMAYLPNLDNTRRFYTKDFLRSYHTIFHNELCGIMKKQGYEINNYSIFDIDSSPVKVTPYLTELTYRSVLGQTFFNKLRRDIGWHFIKLLQPNKTTKKENEKIDEAVKRIDETFKGIIESAKNPPAKPQFLYAHFLIPHETYYYDSSGNRLDNLYTARTDINKKDYLNHVIYANKILILPLVDSVFKYARRPFIMIIQSDHGYRNYPPDKVNLEFENFTALYFPDKDYSTIPDSLSSVNTFRFILNKYFKQNMPILKDSSINLYKQNSY